MLPTSCAFGCSGKSDSWMRRPVTVLWPVSTHPISRNDAPDPINCNAVAAEIIPMIRPSVYPEPCLLTGAGKRTAEGSKNADDEFDRRNVERELYQELSRYYPLGRRKAWARRPLLLEGKHWRDHSTY
jgi:hypothetical protein